MLFILCFSKLTCKSKQSDTKYTAYRLSDVVNGWIYKHQPQEYFDYPTNYPNSIATTYMYKSNTFNDINVLNSIIPYSIATDINVHVRLGDVLIDHVNGMYIFKHNSNKESYGYQPKDILNVCKRNDISKINLYYNFHKDPRLKHINMKANFKYLEELCDMLKHNDVKVSLKNNSNPDIDFIEMCNSKIFVKSKGGFSDLISKIVEKRNNIVLEV